MKQAIHTAQYTFVENIKIYDGTTLESLKDYNNKVDYLKSITQQQEPLFTVLQPSTLTAQGALTNVSFDEKAIIDTLSEPTGDILMFGCNYGEKYNVNYKPILKNKPSSRGRKPKPRIRQRRKVQGNGKYFSSQITFLIQHPDNHEMRYQIKLFRNGVFQVPGIRNPNMHDLVKPIVVLRDFLKYNFDEDIQVVNFMAVMRNYKACLVNKYYHVNLQRLEEIITKEKTNPQYNNFVNRMIETYSVKHQKRIKTLVGNYNPLNIAEITYNTDRCFCLIIKFYRPSITDVSKKTTIKLLKKGKINFDGGNSQQEVEELYTWLEFMYHKYKDEILFDTRNIVNTYSDDDKGNDSDLESVYEENLQTTRQTRRARRKPNKNSSIVSVNNTQTTPLPTTQSQTIQPLPTTPLQTIQPLPVNIKKPRKIRKSRKTKNKLNTPVYNSIYVT